MKQSRAPEIALCAIFSAVTATLIKLVWIPIPATGGGFNFSDIAIYFAAFSFGPWIGGIVGGLGGAIGDLWAGFPEYSGITFFAHGLQGLLAGLLADRKGRTGMVLGWLAGTIAMVAVYFAGQFWILRKGPAAWVEVPPNILQNVAGAVVGTTLFYAVRRAYPPVMRVGRPTEWHEG